MQIEEGKYYRTQDGRKVGPARKINDDFTWARWLSGGEILEIVGVRPEHAYHTELVSEWADNTPKPWRDMTDEEKGALLLAHHEGKLVEAIDPKDPEDAWGFHPEFNDDYAYRVKPEPMREVVPLYIRNPLHKKIGTITLVDGEPDCSTIKMEKL